MAIQQSASDADPRVRLAAERTLLAWIRTGLGMMGFGFVVARFGLFLRAMEAQHDASPAQSIGLSTWLGTGLVVLGIVVTFLAGVQHQRTLWNLDRGLPFPVPAWPMATTVAFVLAVIGIGMVLYLLRLGV